MPIAKWVTFGLLCSVAALPSPVEIVIVHCKEDLSWVAEYGYNTIATVLDKCGSSDGPGHHMLQRNTGREGGSYLQFIVDRYESLADWTVFTQGEKPTYGYKGHHLGGGHMMKNVLFQDYVKAAANRKNHSLFFVFSTVLVASSENVYQCLRNGYGDEYEAPARAEDRMCGTVGEWQRWYPFPEWFKDMVRRLQAQQGAPIKGFDPTAVLEHFGVRPTSVMFFAQGARFGASREAIQARPKAYYEGLLRHFNDVDPWAGYYLEWLWYYVLGGNPAPCGFEGPVLHNHQMWKEDTLKRRGPSVILATISGVSGDGTNTTLSGTVLASSLGGTLQPPSTDGSVILDSNSKLNVDSQLTVSGTSTNNRFVGNPGAQIQLQSANLISTIPVSFVGVTVSGTGGSFVIDAADTSVLQSCTIPADITIADPSNGQVGRQKFQPTATDVALIKMQFNFMQGRVTTQAKSADFRRNLASFIVLYYCGNAHTGAVDLQSGNALQLDSACQVTGQQWANTIGTLSTATGSVVQVLNVSSSSLATYISTFSNPASATIDVVATGAAGSFTKPLIVYDNPGSCTTAFSPNIEGCPSGYSCSATGGTYSANASQCALTYSQSPSSSNNDGLLGLIALVALVPIIALAAAAAWLLFFRPGPEAHGMMMPTDGFYPSDGGASYMPSYDPGYNSPSAAFMVPSVAAFPYPMGPETLPVP